MKARVLKGSKREIAETLSHIDGDVREAIIFVEELVNQGSPAKQNGSAQDIFKEMEPFTVRRGDLDDSRESIYRRMDGE